MQIWPISQKVKSTWDLFGKAFLDEKKKRERDKKLNNNFPWLAVVCLHVMLTIVEDILQPWIKHYSYTKDGRIERCNVPGSLIKVILYIWINPGFPTFRLLIQCDNKSLLIWPNFGLAFFYWHPKVGPHFLFSMATSYWFSLNKSKRVVTIFVSCLVFCLFNFHESRVYVYLVHQYLEQYLEHSRHSRNIC